PTGPSARHAAWHTDRVASTKTRNLGRISEIAQVAVKHGFGYFFETHRLTDLVPGRQRVTLEGSPSERGQHLREMLDELGPTFVKFGQLLSTRPDIVPPDILVELQGLQDDVRPFPYEDVERVIREELELSVEQLFTEFARSIRQELDYRLEARNAEVFHHRFAGHPRVQIPRVYWSYTRSRVLTLELLEGIQLADLPQEAWSIEERRRLAYLMTETWMTMIFRHGFFHGDPHPANIFVLEDGEQIGIVDFGQVGKLTDDDMSKLTGLFIDAANE